MLGTLREKLDDLLRDHLGEQMNLDSWRVCAGLKRLHSFSRDGKIFS